LSFVKIYINNENDRSDQIVIQPLKKISNESVSVIVRLLTLTIVIYFTGISINMIDY